ncbi:MAG: hypothetical protein PV344_08000, partial [Anaplasma sp.]|nr:hypothetical protein [Anaplasma sp.]
NATLRQKFQDVGVPQLYKFLDEACFPAGLGHFGVGRFGVGLFGADFSVHGHFGARTFRCTDISVHLLFGVRTFLKLIFYNI